MFSMLFEIILLSSMFLEILIFELFSMFLGDCFTVLHVFGDFNI